uniref:Uncharacterized protein n=1 Tax=Oryza meridionalis TaxID=40149 RepID=A0A0E0EG42_9ORYZ
MVPHPSASAAPLLAPIAVILLRRFVFGGGHAGSSHGRAGPDRGGAGDEATSHATAQPARPRQSASSRRHVKAAEDAKLIFAALKENRNLLSKLEVIVGAVDYFARVLIESTRPERSA